MASLINAPTGPKLSPWTKLSVVNPRLGCSSVRRCRSFVTQAKVREIFMPALSSTMTEGKIVSWTKSEGDKVKKGESVVVVESDKADMDVETFYDGYLAAIVVEEGNVAPVGSAIALLAETEEEIAEAKAKAMSNGSATTASSAPPIPSPEPVATAAAVSESKPQSVSVSTAPKIEPSSSAPAAIADAHPASEGGKRVIATPYAKKLAKEYKLDLAQVAGSGPNGRIVAKDIEAIAGAGASTLPVPSQQPSVSAAPVTVAPKEQAAASIVPGTSVPFTAMQSAVCRNMVESLQVPVFRVGYSIVTDKLDALYKKIKSKDVTMTALLAKATALALVKHPVLNACCKDGKSFTYNGNINIAVAVAIDGGLITPVLQDANKVDIYTLSRKWKELVGKARAKQLQPQEYNTGTFTLSNLGMFGVDRFDAIIPPGTGAIMAVGSSQPTVVATADGLIGVKSQMQVNVTADHRIIYGADVAAFLQTLAQIIEQPDELTL